MPGVVKSIACEAGDSVEEGTTIVVLEAMKMQNPLFAPMTGKVYTALQQAIIALSYTVLLILVLQIKEVNVQPGDSIGEDEIILEFYPEEDNKVNESKN